MGRLSLKCLEPGEHIDRGPLKGLIAGLGPFKMVLKGFKGVKISDSTVMWEVGTPEPALRSIREQAMQTVFQFSSIPKNDNWMDVAEDLQRIQIQAEPHAAKGGARPIPTITVAHESFAGTLVDLPHMWRRKNGPLVTPDMQPADFRDMARLR